MPERVEVPPNIVGPCQDDNIDGRHPAHRRQLYSLQLRQVTIHVNIVSLVSYKLARHGS